MRGGEHCISCGARKAQVSGKALSRQRPPGTGPTTPPAAANWRASLRQKTLRPHRRVNFESSLVFHTTPMGAAQSAFVHNRCCLDFPVAMLHFTVD